MIASLIHSGVPPLEDMSELIDQVNKLRKDVLPGSPVESSTKTADTPVKKKTVSSSQV